MNNWYVITGGPSTGKSTLIAELKNLGYKTHDEASRTLIDEAVAKGIDVKVLRSDEKKFQENTTLLKKQLEDQSTPEEVTFFDRGMHDSIAYLNYYGFNVEDWVEDLARHSKYKKVFLLEPLSEYRADYARIEGKDFIKKIHEILLETYNEYGIDPVILPNTSVEKRLDLILENIKGGANG